MFANIKDGRPRSKISCNKAANHRRNESHVVTMTCRVRRAGSEPHGSCVLGAVTCLRLKCSPVLPWQSRGWQCPFLRSAITGRELILTLWPITPSTSECYLVYHNCRARSSPRSCLLQKLACLGRQTVERTCWHLQCPSASSIQCNRHIR